MGVSPCVCGGMYVGVYVGGCGCVTTCGGVIVCLCTHVYMGVYVHLQVRTLTGHAAISAATPSGSCQRVSEA